MKNLLKIGFGLLLAVAATIGFVACGGDDEGEEKAVVLTPSQTSINADGTDAVTFTVKHGTDDVTSTAVIYNEATGEQLTGDSFTTTTEGTHSFYAEYNDIKSATISVTAEKKVLLVASETTISASGMDDVVFTVKYGIDDVTASATIYNSTEEKTLESNVFNTLIDKTYSFYAEYNGKQSGLVDVSAENSADLVITADKSTYIAGGSDVITLTVKYKGTDVTSSAKILSINEGYDGYTEFNSNILTPGEAKSYFLKAVYDGVSSNLLVLGPKFFHKVAMFRFTATWCGPCTTFSSTVDGAMSEVGDKLVQSLIHSDDAYSPAASVLNPLYTAYEIGTGIPFVNYDLTETQTGTVAAAKFKQIINTHAAVEANAGIKAVSSVSGTTANVDIEVWANATDTYYVGAHLLEDGIVGYQNGGGNSYVHNNVFRAIQGGAKGTSIGEIAAGGKGTVSYSFDLSSYVADNCHIMIYVTKLVDNAYVVDNVIDVPVNGSVDYAFAE